VIMLLTCIRELSGHNVGLVSHVLTENILWLLPVVKANALMLSISEA
jgi:hypothetical protein